MLSSSYDVIPVDANVLTKEPWQATASLLVIPGGRDLPFVDSLSPTGTKAIRDWVHQGGRYLGICAGAYFACSKVEFEIGRKGYEVVGSRELQFLPGIGRGSVTPNFIYNDTDTGARAARVSLDLEALNLKGKMKSSSIDLYCNGGPFFELYPASESATANTVSHSPVVLARYAGNVLDLAIDKPAIVECSPGMGKAILIGPHFEIGSAAISPEPSLQELRSSLIESDQERNTLIRAIFTRLGLRLNEETVDPNAIPVHSLTYLCISPQQQTAVQPVITTWLQSLFDKSKFIDSTFILKDSVNTLRFLNGESHTSPLTTSTTDSSDVPIVWTPGGKPPAVAATPLFDLSKYFDSLESTRTEISSPHTAFGSAIMYAEVIGSTQTLLEKNGILGNSLPHGIVCVGSHQFSGRGR
jgi:biotin--protein ligase